MLVSKWISALPKMTVWLVEFWLRAAYFVSEAVVAELEELHRFLEEGVGQALGDMDECLVVLADISASLARDAKAFEGLEQLVEDEECLGHQRHHERGVRDAAGVEADLPDERQQQRQQPAQLLVHHELRQDDVRPFAFGRLRDDAVQRPQQLGAELYSCDCRLLLVRLDSRSAALKEPLQHLPEDGQLVEHDVGQWASQTVEIAANKTGVQGLGHHDACSHLFLLEAAQQGIAGLDAVLHLLRP